MVLRSLLVALLFLLVACATVSTVESFIAQGKEVAKEKKYEEALAYYEKALALEPNNTSALYNAGVACAKLARNDKALEYFEKIISLSDINNFSHTEEARYNIASIKLAQGKYKEAIAIALVVGDDGEKIIEKSLEKLRESGFLYKMDVQVQPEMKLAFPPELIEKGSEAADITILASIDEKGMLTGTNCYEAKNNHKFCELAVEYLKTQTFIPAYDFTSDKAISSWTFFNIFADKSGPTNISWHSFPDAEKAGNLPEAFASSQKGGDGKTAVSSEGKTVVSSGGTAVVMGAIDRKIIDEFVKINLGRIKLCYERGLAKEPSLAGKIVVNFIISKTGVVSSSKIQRSTMNSPSVENCVAEAVGNILFPKVEGGGIVIVTYPFIFKHTD